MVVRTVQALLFATEIYCRLQTIPTSHLSIKVLENQIKIFIFAL